MTAGHRAVADALACRAIWQHVTGLTGALD